MTFVKLFLSVSQKTFGESQRARSQRKTFATRNSKRDSKRELDAKREAIKTFSTQRARGQTWKNHYPSHDSKHASWFFINYIICQVEIGRNNLHIIVSLSSFSNFFSSTFTGLLLPEPWTCKAPWFSMSKPVPKF